MKLRNRIAVMLTLGGVAFGAMSLHQRPARAQIDPMRTSYGVYESRPGTTPVLLGEIYREGRDVTRYTEHWVLYPGFVNPSGNNDVTLEIRPGLREYRNAADFFARVPFTRGSRYVHVDCLDTEERPVAR